MVRAGETRRVKARSAKSSQPAHDAAPAAGRALTRSERRSLLVVGLCSLSLAIVAAVAMTWNRLFPVPADRLVEVAWTHHCECVHRWVTSLRERGFTVKEYELASLGSVRRRWAVPSEALGCHPAKFLGYIIDGHLSPEMLRRLAAQPPNGVAVVQQPQMHGTVSSFEVIAANGKRSAWP